MGACLSNSGEWRNLHALSSVDKNQGEESWGPSFFFSRR